MKMEAETRRLHLQAKEWQRLPAITRSHQNGTDSPFRVFRRNQPSQHPDFRLLASRTGKEQILLF